VYGVHRHLVIVGASSLKRDLVKLDVVRLEDLVFVKRERVFHSYILDVISGYFFSWGSTLISERAVRIVEEIAGFRSTLSLVVLLSFTYKLSKNRNVFQLLDVNLKNVFHLLERSFLFTSSLTNRVACELAFIS
jgi:hypothetical protein